MLSIGVYIFRTAASMPDILSNSPPTTPNSLIAIQSNAHTTVTCGGPNNCVPHRRSRFYTFFCPTFTPTSTCINSLFAISVHPRHTSLPTTLPQRRAQESTADDQI